jgi:hypothetical protein
VKTLQLIAPLCAFVACASISGTQSFEATRQFTLPSVGTLAANTASQTITAMGAVDQLSFAESVLDDVDRIRERDHIDSAEATVRVVSVRLSTDTTFAGVQAVRVQLVTATETIELCSRTLSAEDQKGSSLRCESDHVMDEATLEQSSTTDPAQIGAQLEVSDGVTATKLNSVVTFEVEVHVDASL